MSITDNFSMYNYFKKEYLLHDSDDIDEVVSQLGQIGIQFKDEGDISSGVKFDPNLFAEYMTQAVTAVRDKSGNIYLYHRKKGIYIEFEESMLEMLCLQVMNQLQDYKMWDFYREKIGLEAFRRNITKTVTFGEGNMVRLKNGLYNIESMEFKNVHSPQKYLLTQLPIKYHENAACPQFMKFINDITSKDSELILVLQEILGYCLSHSTKAEKAFIFYGPGKNGKSVLAKVMEQLAGVDNISNVTLTELNSVFGMEPMVGKVLNIASENEIDGKFNTERFKSIVSGDSVSINRKFKKPIAAVLYCKLVFVCNTLPEVNDTSYGFLRKLMIVPFNVTISDEMEDVHLYEKLVDELSGIFNWAMEGFHRLKENQYKFSTCQAIDNCAKSFRDEVNPTKIFWKDTYEVSPGMRLLQSDIYVDYQKWAKYNNVKETSKFRFWKLLREKANDSQNPIKLNEVKVRGKRYIEGYRRIRTGKSIQTGIANGKSHPNHQEV